VVAAFATTATNPATLLASVPRLVDPVRPEILVALATIATASVISPASVPTDPEE